MDNSLPIEEYVTLGVPSLDQPWTDDDYKKANEALERLSQAHSDQLPRFPSLKSGRLFSRLNETRELQDMIDKKTPIGTRMARIRRHDVLIKTFNIYSQADVNSRGQYERETVMLIASMLEADSLLMTFITQYIDGGGRSDPMRQQFESAFPQIQNATQTNLESMLKEIANPGFFSVSSRTSIIEAVKLYAEPTLAYMPPDRLTSFKGAVAEMKDSEENPDLKLKLDELLVKAKQTKSRKINPPRAK